MLTNLARAGLARVRNVPYEPLPTVYDGLFPNGTWLTAPQHPPHRPPADEPKDADSG